MSTTSFASVEAEVVETYDSWEEQLIHGLLPAAASREKGITYLATVNLYVALKSRPLAIFVGPQSSGKTALVQHLAHLLVADVNRFCTMVGHARWAAGSTQVGMLVEAQTRLNKNALFTFIDEAWQPEHIRNAYLVCLERISPAELGPFFTRSGLELLFRQFLHLNEPQTLRVVPYPPNLTLIGTMDVPRFHWWEASLLEATTVVPWPAEAEMEQPASPELPAAACGELFLSSCVRSPAVAYARLSRLARPLNEPFAPLLRVATFLEEETLPLPREVIHTIITFAGNAWADTGKGLFDEESAANLEIALKLGIVQYLLPWLQTSDALSPTIRDRLYGLLGEPYVTLARILGG